MSLEQLANLERKYNEYAILNEALSVSNVRDLPKSRSILTPITKEMIADYNTHLDKYTQAAGTPMYQLPSETAIELEEIPERIDITARPKKTDARNRAKVQEYSTTIERLRTDIQDLEDYARTTESDFLNGTLVMSEERYVELQYSIIDEISKRSRGLAVLEQRIANIGIIGTQQIEEASERSAEIDNAERRNREKLKTYAEEVRSLNNGLKLQEQGPNESNEEYAQRIENLREIVEPARIKVNAESNVIANFKKNMKEVTRDEFIIQEILSAIGIETAFNTNKIFPALKKKILETYGYNNPNINADILTDTIRNYLSGDFKRISIGNDAPMIELKNPDFTEAEAEAKEEGDEEGNILEFIPPQSQEPLYFIKFEYKVKKAGNPKPVIMFSKRREQGTFRRITESNRHAVDQLTEGNLSEIEKKLKKDNKYRQSEDALYGMLKNKQGGESRSVSNILGWGIEPEKIPLKAKLGKINILPQKLFYNNILILKDNKNNNIKEIPNIKVSDKFAKLIFRILKSEKISDGDVAHLSTPEQSLYNLIIKIAELHKTLPHTSEATVQKLKHDLSLIEGEIEAGNDNPLLIRDAKKIVEKLYRFDIISFSDAKNYNKQFN